MRRSAQGWAHQRETRAAAVRQLTAYREELHALPGEKGRQLDEAQGFRLANDAAAAAKDSSPEVAVGRVLELSSFFRYTSLTALRATKKSVAVPSTDADASEMASRRGVSFCEASFGAPRILLDGRKRVGVGRSSIFAVSA